MQKIPFFWLAIFFLLSTIFLLRYKIVGQAVYGDGIYYWGYTHSIILDHDLDLRNEGAHSYSPETNNTFTLVNPTDLTDLMRGRYYPIGTSLFWVPLFFLIHIIAQFLYALGFTSIPNGYSDIYQIGVGLLNVGYVVLGLFFIYKALLLYFAKNVAKLSILTILFASNLLYYGSIDVINSHPTSFLLSSIFLYLFSQSTKERTNIKWFAMGILVGALSLIRLQDGLLGITLFGHVVSQFITGHRKHISKNFLGLLIAGGGAVIGFFPQLIASSFVYHSAFVLPYTFSMSLFHFQDPKLLEILLDPTRGLVFYSPVYLIGFIGLFFVAKTQKIIQWSFIPPIIASYGLVAIWPAWSQGESFGIRMFISLLPLLSFGLASLLKTLLDRLSKITIILLIGIFILHNLIMILNFHLFLHNPTFVGQELSRSGKLKTLILNQVFQFK